MSTMAEKLLISLSCDPSESRSVSTRCGSREDDPFWVLKKVFPEFQRLVKNKRVLDFGCGWGRQSIALVELGAQYVLGVDTNPGSLKEAEDLRIKKGLEKNVEFVSALSEEMLHSFDVVISHNSFEHFSDPQSVLSQMKKMVKPEGRILITFGPPWFSPYGAHMGYFAKVPWVNIFFSEETVMRARSRYRSDGAQRYEDIEGGLNKMTIRKFERIIDLSGLKMEYRRYDCVKGLNFLGKIPCLRELFINHVSCICTL